MPALTPTHIVHSQVAEDSMSSQFVRVAVFTLACLGGRTTWAAWEAGHAIPSEADRLVSKFHVGHVGLWPGDVCNGTVCSRGGESFLDGAHTKRPATGSNPVTDFIAFSDADAKTLASFGLGGRWQRVAVRKEVCSAPTPRQAGMAPPGNFGYTAFIPAKSLASVRIADVLRAITDKLSAIGGPAVVILGTANQEPQPPHPSTRSGSRLGRTEKRRREDWAATTNHINRLTDIVAVVQRSGSDIARAFRERWLNNSIRARATRQTDFERERTGLRAAMRTFQDAAMVVMVDQP